jgi:hypothetical protein
VSAVETRPADQTPGQYEDIFQVDLDGDGIIGVPPAPLVALALAPAEIVAIETNGDSMLSHDGSQYLIGDGILPEIGLTRNGGPVGPDSFVTGWQAIQAEAAADGGFNVLFERPNGAYWFWTTDAAGERVTAVETRPADQTPGQYEHIFQFDLDGDGAIGQPPVDFII